MLQQFLHRNILHAEGIGHFLYKPLNKNAIVKSAYVCCDDIFNSCRQRLNPCFNKGVVDKTAASKVIESRFIRVFTNNFV